MKHFLLISWSFVGICLYLHEEFVKRSYSKFGLADRVVEVAKDEHIASDTMKHENVLVNGQSLCNKDNAKDWFRVIA